MLKSRLRTATLTGAALGVICIIGAGLRFGYEGNLTLIFALWYNRVLMGFLVGLSGDLQISTGKENQYLRGFILGLLVSAAYFFTSGMTDWVSFLAGGVYGLIIEVVIERY
jgi:hypothetical protein